MKGNGQDRPVVIAVAPNEPIAEAWRELLASEGISALVRTSDPLSVAYLQSSPFGCEILVLPGEAQRAIEILSGVGAEELEEEYEYDDEQSGPSTTH